MRSQAVMGKTNRQLSRPRVTTMPPSTKSRKAGGMMTRPLSSTLYWYSPNGIVSQAPGGGVGGGGRDAGHGDVFHVLHATGAPLEAECASLPQIPTDSHIRLGSTPGM